MEITITTPVGVITKGDDDVELDLGQIGWTKTLIERAIEHGIRQKFGDAMAGKKGTDATEALERVRDMLYDGTWSTGGGGGKRVAPLEQAMRNIVTAKLMESGEKKADATKRAVDVRDAIEYLVVNAYPDMEQADVDAKVESIYEAVKAKAEAIVEATNSIDIGV